MNDQSCDGCQYFDAEDNVCSAMECWPVADCDEPLPCEREVNNDDG